MNNPASPLYQRYSNLDVRRGSLRAQVLIEAAHGIGVREGFAEESERISTVLDSSYADTLDSRYDFRRVMIDAHLVPPVITELRQVEQQPGERLIYLTLGAFRIVRPARLALSPPTWRDYLEIPVRRPLTASPISPQDDGEKTLWDRAYAEGVAKGIEEARASFSEDLNRLDRDYDGMQRYRELARQGAVSLPKVDVSSRKVRIGEKGNRVFIGEQIVTLRVAPKFRAVPAAAFHVSAAAK
jgi:defect-in-organelle-trafficking protein DotC